LFIGGNRVKKKIVIAVLFFAYAGIAGAQQKAVKAEILKTSASKSIDVYRSASCGCCGKWLEHLAAHQFKVIEHLVDDVKPIKSQYGVAPELASCHTAIVDGYVIEGHVPAGDIKTLLQQKPKISGLTVPGMPVGTPGMEMGAKKDAYQVLSFENGKAPSVFNQYSAD
jgi:hypothetical protein